MQSLFVGVLNLSLTASVLLLAVLVIRCLIKRIVPRFTVCALWGAAALCLVLPFSVESDVSVLPSNEIVVLSEFKYTPITEKYTTELWVKKGVTEEDMPQPPVIVQSGFDAVDNRINASISGSVMEKAYAVSLVKTCANIWLGGVLLMIAYFVFSMARLKRRLNAAVCDDGGVIRNSVMETPFVLGVIRPRIYLPCGLNEETEGYILAHERAHIKRLDHIVKPLGFFVLALHWFNPLVWAAYFLLSRDIEIACDEKVIKNMDEGERKKYAAALLECGAKSTLVAVCPVAFGGTEIKNRIVSALHYQKRAAWIAPAVLVLGAVLLAFFGTKPVSASYNWAPQKEASIEFVDKGEGWAFTSDGTLYIGGNSYVDEMFFEQKPWDKHKNNVKALVITGKLDVVGAYAFGNYPKLTTVEMHNEITSIKEGAFYGCAALESVKLSTKIKSIEDSAFCGCKKLKSIDFPTNLRYIEARAFKGCTSLKRVAVPNGVAIISEKAFYGCSSLQEISLPNTLTYYAEDALMECNSLSYIVFNGTMEEWESVSHSRGAGNVAVECVDGVVYTEGGFDFSKDGGA